MMTDLLLIRLLALVARLRAPQAPSGSVVWDNATAWQRRAIADELALLLVTSREDVKELELEVNG
jgi:hypothetical protein